MNSAEAERQFGIGTRVSAICSVVGGDIAMPVVTKKSGVAIRPAGLNRKGSRASVCSGS